MLWIIAISIVAALFMSKFPAFGGSLLAAIVIGTVVILKGGGSAQFLEPFIGFLVVAVVFIFAGALLTLIVSKFFGMFGANEDKVAGTCTTVLSLFAGVGVMIAFSAFVFG